MPVKTKAGAKTRKQSSSSNKVEPVVKLNERQQLFARCYLNGFSVQRVALDGSSYVERVRMGNGVKSYAFAFGHEDLDSNPATYNTCGVLAYELLKNVKIIEYLENLKIVNGWTHQAMDNRRLEIAYTGKHEHSLKALEQMDKLDGRITDKAQVDGNITIISGIPRPAAISEDSE